MHTKFWSENLKGRDHYKVPSDRQEYEYIIRLHLREIGWDVVDCTHLAQDRD
jgi:hypothetical protein